MGVTLFVITLIMVSYPLLQPPLVLTSTLTKVIQFGVAWLMGARFDIAFKQLTSGQFWPASSSEEAEAVREAYDAAKTTVKAVTSSVVAHGEL